MTSTKLKRMNLSAIIFQTGWPVTPPVKPVALIVRKGSDWHALNPSLRTVATLDYVPGADNAARLAAFTARHDGIRRHDLDSDGK